MTTINYGYYVTYKGNNYLVVRMTGDLCDLNAPDQKRVRVHKRNLKPLNCKKAHMTTYRGTAYLLTKSGLIYSCATGKQMNWGKDDGNRKAIISNVRAATMAAL